MFLLIRLLLCAAALTYFAHENRGGSWLILHTAPEGPLSIDKAISGRRWFKSTSEVHSQINPIGRVKTRRGFTWCYVFGWANTWIVSLLCFRSSCCSPLAGCCLQLRGSWLWFSFVVCFSEPRPVSVPKQRAPWRRRRNKEVSLNSFKSLMSWSSLRHSEVSLSWRWPLMCTLLLNCDRT